MKVHLRVVQGPDIGRTFTFETRDRFLIGRAPTAHFQITQDNYFSRHHMLLEVNPPNVLLQDLQSTNGTIINDKGKIQAPVNLTHGDRIGGGKTLIELAIEDDPASSQPIPIAQPTLEKVAVKCLRCGAHAANELPRSRAENMAYFCAT